LATTTGKGSQKKDTLGKPPSENGRTVNREAIVDTKVATLFEIGEADLSHFWDVLTELHSAYVQMEQALEARHSEPRAAIEAAQLHQAEAKLEHLQQTQTEKERTLGDLRRELREERERRHQLEHELNNLRTQEGMWLEAREKLITELEAEQQANQHLHAQLATLPPTISSNLVNSTDISQIFEDLDQLDFEEDLA
jgi:chromosome segregation ATPase